VVVLWLELCDKTTLTLMLVMDHHAHHTARESETAVNCTWLPTYRWSVAGDYYPFPLWHSFRMGVLQLQPWPLTLSATILILHCTVETDVLNKCLFSIPLYFLRPHCRLFSCAASSTCSGREFGGSRWKCS